MDLKWPERTDSPDTDSEDGISPVVVGCKVYVRFASDNTVHQAEILHVRTVPGDPTEKEFYIHYINFNKRLDEYITADRIEWNRGVEPPKEPTSATKRVKASGNSSDGANLTPGKACKAKRRHTLLAKAARAAAKASGSGDSTPARRRGRPPGLPSDSPAPSEPPDEEETEDLEAEYKQPSTLSKDDEIEKLRHGGSMTNSHAELSRVRNLNSLFIGRYQIEAWYFSPYPQEYADLDLLYLCEFCLTPIATEFQLKQHARKCKLRHPPGNEIYRQHDFSFFEIDGRRQKTWCRNLCLLSKLFLDHKTLYYDVDPFLFYVLCQWDDTGAHLIGYFSKEKDSADNYNVACILTLPQHQRKGYGRYLIEFSYLLSRREGKLGSPEKPLSDLGLLGYRAYWSDVIVKTLLECRNLGESGMSIEDLAAATNMTVQDVKYTLQMLDAFRYWKGQLVVYLSQKVVESYQKSRDKRRLLIDPQLLVDWEPPRFNQSRLRFL